MPKEPKQPVEDKQPDEKELIGSLMDQIAGKGEGDKKESSSSWPVTMVMLGVLVLVISILGFKLAWAKRKAAELAVKVRRAEEEKTRAEENVKLGENATARQAANEEVKARSLEVLGLKARIAKRHTEQKAMVEQLSPITSWDDINVVDGRESP